MTTLHLLLADGETHAPGLPRGLPAGALRRLPAPRATEGSGSTLADRGAAPDDLRAQRWGVVVPAGARDRVRWIDPLVAHRAAQQGAEVRVYEAPPGIDGWAAGEWIRREYLGGKGTLRERPRYLLLLGDLEELSEGLQQALGAAAFVGRLSLEGEEAFGRYAAKVVAAEGAGAERGNGRVWLHAPPPRGEEDEAARLAQERLIGPCLVEGARAGIEMVDVSDGSGEGLVRALRDPEPSALLTVCHGLGAPEGGWGAGATQRRLQGALKVGEDRVLSADGAREGALLAGGIWLMLACFSAATPGASAYLPWTACFSAEDRAELETVLRRNEPLDGRGFLSALPAALLGNAEGPLAILGHSDIAWVGAFHDIDHPGRAGALRVLEPLILLAEGRPAGVALAALLEACRQEEQALLEVYAMEAYSGAGLSAAERARADERRAQAWLGRQDLRSYLLLGDPAARLGGSSGRERA